MLSRRNTSAILSLALCFTVLTACNKRADSNGDALQLVFSNNTYQLTGVAITPSGRLFTNYPLWSDTYLYAATEILSATDERPYPNVAMNQWKPGDDGMSKWVCVQAVVADDAGALWVVDPASPKMQGVYASSNKLVKIDLATNTVQRTYPLSPAAGSGSYANDVRVDNARGFAYITNSQEGGIIVVNLSTGAVRQVLKGHSSTVSDPNFVFTIDGKVLTKNGQPVKIHSDGIALHPSGDYLYYKPLTDDRLFRVPTALLRDFGSADATIAAAVESLGRFTTTDGMIFDKKGNLYLGDLQQQRIVRIAPDLTMTEIVRDARLIWPDSYSISNDGYLYISCSQINKQPEYNEGVNKRTTPYTIYRMKLP